MTDSLSRAFVSDIEVRGKSEDGRTVAGIVVPFGRVARVSDGGAPYDEGFQHGAFTRTIQQRGPARVKLLSHHNGRTNPLGVATLLREDAAGLYGEFKVSNTGPGNDALELLRDGALDSFSVGFSPVKHVVKDRITWRTEVALREASLVTFPAYEDARVTAVRAWDSLTDEQREEAARMFSEATELRSLDSDESSAAMGTPAGPAPSDEPPVGTSARISQFKFAAMLRQEGIL